MAAPLGEFIEVIPAQQRVDEQWYQGTADAIYQNFYTLQEERPDVMDKLMAIVNQMDETEEKARKAGFANR